MTDGGGPLTVTKKGSGTLTLSGVNTHTGPTNVQAGILVLNGSLQNSVVTVGSGAFLRGTGQVTSILVDGTIAPGNSIGTLTVLDNLVMGSGGTYQAEVDSSGAADLINVLGSASLTGKLDVLMSGTAEGFLGKTFTILTAAGGVTGQFTSQTTNLLQYTIRYLGNAVQISFGSEVPNPKDMLPATANANETAMAEYLNSISSSLVFGSDLANIFGILLNLSDDPQALANALDQIQPSSLDTAGIMSYRNMDNASMALQPQLEKLIQQAGDDVWALSEVCPLAVEKERSYGRMGKTSFGLLSPQRLSAFRGLTHQRRTLAFHPQSAHTTAGRRKSKFIETFDLQSNPPPINQRIQIGKANVWLQNYGEIGSMKASSWAPGYRGKIGGLSVGGDYEFLPRAFAGAFAGISTSPYDLKSNDGNGGLKSYYGGFYAAKITDFGLYVDGQVMAGSDQYHTKRNINFSSIHRKASAKHKGYHIFTKAEIGQIVPLSRLVNFASFDMMLQPFVNVAYALAHEQGFTEKGADSLDFKIKGRNSNFMRSQGGAIFYKTFMVCETLIRPEFSLSYMNTSRVGGSRGRIKGGLVGEPQTLVVRGDHHTINQVAPELGLTAQFKNGAYILGNVRGELGSRLNTLSGVVTLGYNF